MRGSLNMKPEFQKPGMNPFFSALAGARAQNKEATPLQKLYTEVRDLEKIAEAGDLKAWQEKLPQVQQLAETVHEDAIKLLEVQVQIKKFELTLYLKASKQAMLQAEAAKTQAKQAELGDNTVASRELWNKSQKFIRLGEHFQQRLKTQLGRF